MPRFAIRTNERVLLVGKTGSGKSYMARALVAGIQRLIVLDPKGTLGAEFAADWNLEDWSNRGAQLLAKGKPVRLRVPPPGPDADPVEYWRPYLLAAYEARNVTVYIDEMYGVVPAGRQMPPELQALYTRGRELGIGVYAATQRPSWIPLFAISESEWLFTFRLMLEDDKKRMAGIMGPLVLNGWADQYGYYLFSAQWNAPIYSRGLGA